MKDPEKLDVRADERDFELLKADPYTFEVLSRILRGPCDLVLTDHARFILCHSSASYPVWIWTPDGASEQEKARAWEIAREARPLGKGSRYNLKYELAEYFIGRAKREGFFAGIAMNLLAYDCPAPVSPSHPADGGLYACGEQDLEEAAEMIRQFYPAIGVDPAGEEAILQKAKDHIARRAFFLWKNGEGKTAACCSYKPDGALACLGSVFTLPVFRRRHYAENLVYQVTCYVREKGFQPMLYTDADYAASNACYEKIGYVCRGKLCTIGAG